MCTTPEPGKVNRTISETRRPAEVCQPSAAPDPSADQRVDDHADPEAHQDEPGELQALGHGPRGDGCRGVHEHHLEQEECEDSADIAHAIRQEESVTAQDSALGSKLDEPVVQVPGKSPRDPGANEFSAIFPMAGNVVFTPPNWNANPTSQ